MNWGYALTADGGRLRVPAAAPEERWHVMHAYKSERLAEEMLSRAGGLEHFVPKRCAMRVFHGRKRPCLVPVIPCLVFVRSARVRIVSFKQEVYNGLQFVMGGDGGCRERLVVPDSDMDKLAMRKKPGAAILFVGDDWYGTDKWREYEKESAGAGIRIVYFPYTKGISSTRITDALIKTRDWSDSPPAGEEHLNSNK